MGGLFRRLRKPKEAAPTPEVEPEDESSVAPDPDEGAAVGSEPDLPPPEAEAVPTAPAPVSSSEPLAAPAPAAPEVVPTPAAPAPRIAPPPLPAEDRTAARSSLSPRRTSSSCFVCGTAMDGPWCPTCRIAWVD